MRMLAIETATTICAAALVCDGVVLAERTLNEPHVHAEKLLTLIDAILPTYSSSHPPVDGIALSIGPGSFTGLRIGLSVAKGLCFAWNSKIVPVPTLNALAWNCIIHNIGEENDYILPVLDARRNEVYVALYRKQNNDLVEVSSAQALSYRGCRNLIEFNLRVTIIGERDGKFLSTHEPTSGTGAQYSIVPVEHRQCSAASVGLLGERFLMRGVTADISSLEPTYIKDFVTTAQPQLMVNEHGMV